jgi:DNA-binding GntR family transcriptional regulator
LKPGAMLPSEPALAEEFEVARGTVRAALMLLQRDGRVEVVAGRGRRVVGSNGAAPSTAYETIAQAIRARVEAGEFADGAALPSEAALMAKFDASRNTVRRAYELLEQQGLVMIRQGAGAFVVSR